MVKMNWGHSSYLMAIKINLSYIEVGLQFKMVIEIGPIAPSSIGQQKEIKFILVTI
jgi:hypothetical protein